MMMKNIFVVYSSVLNLDQRYLIRLLMIQSSLEKKTNQIQEKSNFIFSLYHFIYDEHGLEILYVF